MKKSSSLAVAIASVVATVAACGGGPTPPDFSRGEGRATAADGGGSLVNSGQGSTSKSCDDPSAGDLAGCSCSGTSRACWTVTADKRNANGCHDGTQQCVRKGEFMTWGACAGEEAACDAGGSTDKGSTSTTPPPPPANCTCIPGAVRWCDTPAACDWGKQTCTPAGAWGPCVETTDRPTGCSGFGYDEDCCKAANACCQDFDGPDPDKSIGNCAQIACPGDMAK